MTRLLSSAYSILHTCGTTFLLLTLSVFFFCCPFLSSVHALGAIVGPGTTAYPGGFTLGIRGYSDPTCLSPQPIFSFAAEPAPRVINGLEVPYRCQKEITAYGGITLDYKLVVTADGLYQMLVPVDGTRTAAPIVFLQSFLEFSTRTQPTQPYLHFPHVDYSESCEHYVNNTRSGVDLKGAEVFRVTRPNAGLEPTDQSTCYGPIRTTYFKFSMTTDYLNVGSISQLSTNPVQNINSLTMSASFGIDGSSNSAQVVAPNLNSVQRFILSNWSGAVDGTSWFTNGLTVCTSISIEPGLTSLTTLPKLRGDLRCQKQFQMGPTTLAEPATEFKLEILQTPELSSLTNLQVLNYNPDLQAVDHFHVDVSINDAPLLTDLSGLNNIWSNIRTTPSLNAKWFDNSYLSIRLINMNITDLRGCAWTNPVGFIIASCINCPNLNSLNGLTTLSEISLTLHDAPRLTSLSGSTSDALFYYMEFVNTGLENLMNDFTAADSELELHLYNNSALTSLHGLNKFPSLDTLSLKFNPELVNLVGLEECDVFYDFYLEGNAKLASLTGIARFFAGVRPMISIVSNPLLIDYSALMSLPGTNAPAPLGATRDPAGSWHISSDSICPQLSVGERFSPGRFYVCVSYFTHFELYEAGNENIVDSGYQVLFPPAIDHPLRIWFYGATYYSVQLDVYVEELYIDGRAGDKTLLASTGTLATRLEFFSNAVAANVKMPDLTFGGSGFNLDRYLKLCYSLVPSTDCIPLGLGFKFISLPTFLGAEAKITPNSTMPNFVSKVSLYTTGEVPMNLEKAVDTLKFKVGNISCTDLHWNAEDPQDFTVTIPPFTYNKTLADDKNLDFLISLDDGLTYHSTGLQYTHLSFSTVIGRQLVSAAVTGGVEPLSRVVDIGQGNEVLSSSFDNPETAAVDNVVFIVVIGTCCSFSIALIVLMCGRYVCDRDKYNRTLRELDALSVVAPLRTESKSFIESKRSRTGDETSLIGGIYSDSAMRKAIISSPMGGLFTILAIGIVLTMNVAYVYDTTNNNIQYASTLTTAGSYALPFTNYEATLTLNDLAFTENACVDPRSLNKENAPCAADYATFGSKGFSKRGSFACTEVRKGPFVIDCLIRFTCNACRLTTTPSEIKYSIITPNAFYSKLDYSLKVDPTSPYLVHEYAGNISAASGYLFMASPPSSAAEITMLTIPTIYKYYGDPSVQGYAVEKNTLGTDNVQPVDSLSTNTASDAGVHVLMTIDRNPTFLNVVLSRKSSIIVILAQISAITTGILSVSAHVLSFVARRLCSRYRVFDTNKVEVKGQTFALDP